MSVTSRSLLRTSPSLRDTGHHGASIGGPLRQMAVAMPPPLDMIPQPHRQQQKARPSKRALQLTLPAEPEDTNTLAPSTVPPTKNSTDDDDEELFFDLYESPCLLKASNDEFSYQDYQDFGLMCNETFFGGCHYDNINALQKDLDTNDDGIGIVEWSIVFDYEIYYTGDPIPAVDHVETIILEHLSEIIGLQGCSEGDPEDIITSPRVSMTSDRMGKYWEGGGVSNDNGYRRMTTEYIHDFTEEELSRMVAISSDPSDTLDPDYNYCFVPVPSSISSNADCLAVAGAIHLYLNATGDGFLDDPNTRLSIESGFQRLIRFGMQEGLYVSDDVAKHVSFIGSRIYVGDEIPPASNLEGDSSMNGDSTLTQQGGTRSGMIIGVVGVFVFLVLAWVLLAVRGKRNSIATTNEGVRPLQEGDKTALSSLPPSIVDEENPYLIVKAPLSVTQGDRDIPVLPSMVTADTMATLEEDDGDNGEVKNIVTGDSSEKETAEVQPVLSSDDNDTYTTGDLKIFQDDEENEEEEKVSYLPPSMKENEVSTKPLPVHKNAAGEIIPGLGDSASNKPLTGDTAVMPISDEAKEEAAGQTEA